MWTVIAVVAIAIALIVDTIYVYLQLKKLWKKSRYNPANRKKDTVDQYRGKYGE